MANYVCMYDRLYAKPRNILTIRSPICLSITSNRDSKQYFHQDEKSHLGTDELILPPLLIAQVATTNSFIYFYFFATPKFLRGLRDRALLPNIKILKILFLFFPIYVISPFRLYCNIFLIRIPTVFSESLLCGKYLTCQEQRYMAIDLWLSVSRSRAAAKVNLKI